MDEPTMQAIPMDKVWADADFNCRGRISPIDVVDLMKDIETKGLIQPVCVTPISEGEAGFDKGFTFKLIAGFRRHKCHMILQLPTILSVIRTDMKNEVMARSFNLVENLQRADLTILQEARAIQHFHSLGISDTAIGNEIGMSKGWVQVRIMLLSLPPEVQTEVVSCSIPQSGIRELFTIHTSAGAEACFEAVKNIKVAKAKGQKRYTIKTDGAPKNKKRARNLVEINELLTVVQRELGNSFATRLMAWCAGGIDDIEVHKSIQAECVVKGVPYDMPAITV